MLYFFYLITISLQHRHRVKVYRDHLWCKATFRRYDYKFLRTFKRRRGERERQVSPYIISLDFCDHFEVSGSKRVLVALSCSTMIGRRQYMTCGTYTGGSVGKYHIPFDIPAMGFLTVDPQIN